MNELKLRLQYVMPFQVWPYLNNRCRTIVKMELNYPVLGQGMKRGGAVFVTRASEEGRATLNQAGKEAKTEEHSLLVFPEGTRTLKRGLEGLLQFKKGRLYLHHNMIYTSNYPSTKCSLKKSLGQYFREGTMYYQKLKTYYSSSLFE